MQPLTRPQGEILIGARGSKLAVAQAHAVGHALTRSQAGLSYRLVRIKTTGDVRREEALPDIGGKGLFTREIEQALLDGRIDLAVHSLKDLPTESSQGLGIRATPARAPANDALISRDDIPFDKLPKGARVGTSSLRRAAQLLRLRPDLYICPIRGNVDTRIAKLHSGEYHAIVLAYAGLVRLGRGDEASEVLPFDIMMPAPAQGALGVQARTAAGELARVRANDDVELDKDRHALFVRRTAAIDHVDTFLATTAERALLQALGGGCSLPLGAYAEKIDADTLRLRAILLAPDGQQQATADQRGATKDPRALALAVAEELRSAGADAILQANQAS